MEVTLYDNTQVNVPKKYCTSKFVYNLWLAGFYEGRSNSPRREAEGGKAYQSGYKAGAKAKETGTKSVSRCGDDEGVNTNGQDNLAI